MHTWCVWVGAGCQMVAGRPLKKLMANSAHYIIFKISGIKMKYFGATFKAYKSYLLKNANFLGIGNS